MFLVSFPSIQLVQFNNGFLKHREPVFGCSAVWVLIPGESLYHSQQRSTPHRHTRDIVCAVSPRASLRGVYQLAVRRGKQRAAVAVGHSLLVPGCYPITRHKAYQDLGGNYFDERVREAVKRRAVRCLEKLAYRVELAPTAAPAG